MSAKINPAFPVVRNQTTTSLEPGISIRDYFAAKALPAIIGLFKSYPISDLSFMYGEDIAIAAYNIADQMLKAREKGA